MPRSWRALPDGSVLMVKSAMNPPPFDLLEKVGQGAAVAAYQVRLNGLNGANDCLR